LSATQHREAITDLPNFSDLGLSAYLGAVTAEGYVAPRPIVAAALDTRGAVGSPAAEDLDYWFDE
jgi:hypothetical protein